MDISVVFGKVLTFSKSILFPKCGRSSEKVVSSLLRAKIGFSGSCVLSTVCLFLSWDIFIPPLLLPPWVFPFHFPHPSKYVVPVLQIALQKPFLVLLYLLTYECFGLGGWFFLSCGSVTWEVDSTTSSCVIDEGAFKRSFYFSWEMGSLQTC